MLNTGKVSVEKIDNIDTYVAATQPVSLSQHQDWKYGDKACLGLSKGNNIHQMAPQILVQSVQRPLYKIEVFLGQVQEHL